jgi:hypothetical protein
VGRPVDGDRLFNPVRTPTALGPQDSVIKGIEGPHPLHAIVLVLVRQIFG